MRTFVKRFPGLSRTELTYTLCEHLDWLTPAGRPKFDGLLQAARTLGSGRGTEPARVAEDKAILAAAPAPRNPRARTDPIGAVRAVPRQIDPVRLRLASEPRRRTSGMTMSSATIRWATRSRSAIGRAISSSPGSHPLGCVLLGGAAKALGARDQWIGWTDRQRLKNLPWVVNNSRYLIFPWVKVANLASHVLAQLARRVGDDWEARWGYRPLLLETFVDPAHFRGSCYRAAGWTLLGRTSGEGLVRPGKQYRTSPKLIFAKALQADFSRAAVFQSTRRQDRTMSKPSQRPGREAIKEQARKKTPTTVAPPTA